MSSALRNFGVKKEGLTRFVKPESPTYYDGRTSVLFPFSYSNQVLDITYEGNNFKSRMVDDNNEAPGSEADSIVRVLGGPMLVTSLGPNFKAYVRSWRSATIDPNSPIEIYVAPQIFRVQEASYININSNSGESWIISTSAPSSDNYISGNDANKFNKTCVFKTPLTFTVVEGGVTKYITFKSVLDQE